MCVCVSRYLSFSVSLYLYISVCLSICLYLSISVCLYLYLSVSISVCLFLSIFLYLSLLTLRLPGGGALWTPPVVFCILLQKPPLQPMMKLYVNSYTILVVTPMLWSGQKKLIFAHFKASKGRRVQNRDFCTCQFRVLRGIFWGLFMNQKLFRIKKY